MNNSLKPAPLLLVFALSFLPISASAVEADSVIGGAGIAPDVVVGNMDDSFSSTASTTTMEYVTTEESVTTMTEVVTFVETETQGAIDYTKRTPGSVSSGVYIAKFNSAGGLYETSVKCVAKADSAGDVFLSVEKSGVTTPYSPAYIGAKWGLGYYGTGPSCEYASAGIVVNTVYSAIGGFPLVNAAVASSVTGWTAGTEVYTVVVTSAPIATLTPVTTLQSVTKLQPVTTATTTTTITDFDAVDLPAGVVNSGDSAGNFAAASTVISGELLGGNTGGSAVLQAEIEVNDTNSDFANRFSYWK